ncbi:hypothetical protein DUNSADRAFT_1602 [Dunaliella salina]|uniref:Uncharacterized protein n=1 Tax=Dunaliella salina TaxID=3046 RepID=A0ABQ7H8I9_DUNSA|nr:hypothetical protein DUNSADRAFT_1602 [Dunaliella salina]|eukprot:KAF5843175.1 hypothetical protein DUNSADRAFT_1602 [Dunaliella salina]
MSFPSEKASMDQARLQAVREKQMEKQNRWMRERQAEMERVRALEELVFQQQASGDQ